MLHRGKGALQAARLIMWHSRRLGLGNACAVVLEVTLDRHMVSRLCLMMRGELLSVDVCMDGTPAGQHSIYSELGVLPRQKHRGKGSS